MNHTCHAFACETKVPPKLHMCRPHWAMVPKALQRRLWAEYRPGQERRMDPTPAYLRAAAACVEAVAKAEGHPPEAMAVELEGYLAWARMVDDTPEEPAQAALFGTVAATHARRRAAAAASLDIPRGFT